MYTKVSYPLDLWLGRGFPFGSRALLRRELKPKQLRLPMLAITAARVSAAISSGLSVVTNSFPAVCLSVCPLIPGKQGRQ